MSTPSPIIAPLLVAERGTNGAAPEKKRPRSRPYKARISTKIRWAMGDIMDKAISAQRMMRRVLAWAEETRALEEAVGDSARLARLGKLTQDLASLALDVTEMERIVTRATAESVTDDGQP